MPKFIEFELKNRVASLWREQLDCNVVYQREDARESVKYLSRSAKPYWNGK